MRTRIKALAVSAALAASVAVAPPATAQQVVFPNGPGVVVGSSAAPVIPALLATIAGTILLTMLLNGGESSFGGFNSFFDATYEDQPIKLGSS